MYRNPKIAKVAVIGVPDDKTGEAVKAFVVLREGESATVEELVTWARDPANGLTAYRTPKQIELGTRSPRRWSARSCAACSPRRSDRSRYRARPRLREPAARRSGRRRGPAPAHDGRPGRDLGPRGRRTASPRALDAVDRGHPNDRRPAAVARERRARRADARRVRDLRGRAVRRGSVCAGIRSTCVARSATGSPPPTRDGPGQPCGARTRRGGVPRPRSPSDRDPRGGGKHEEPCDPRATRVRPGGDRARRRTRFERLLRPRRVRDPRRRVATRFVTGIEAVVFDLFGTLVFEFPRADWDAWLETSAAVLEADIDAFRAGWEATAIERQTGRLGDIEACLRTVAARAGAWPTDAQIAEALEERAAMYRTWFVPRPRRRGGARSVALGRISAGFGQHVRARYPGDVADLTARRHRRRRDLLE